MPTATTSRPRGRPGGVIFVTELVAFGKKYPDKLTLATSSPSSINHFLGELLKLKSGITWTEVHYKGNAPAINDLVAGHVDIGFQQLTDSLQHIQSGQLRALAVIAPKRVPAIPDVPTIAEGGFPEVQGVTFNGVFAPKGTPPAVIARLSAAIQDALKKDEVIAKLATLGSEARGSTPEQFAKFLQDESQKWADVMKQANIKVSK